MYSELFWSTFFSIQSECGKMRTRIFPNTNTFYAVNMFNLNPKKLTLETIQTKKYISDLLKNCNINKAARIDNLSGRFLKDTADILNLLRTQIFNLSIKLSHFPKDCKVAKLKTSVKKALRQILIIQNYRKSNTWPNYEVFNEKQHSLQIPFWVLKNQSTVIFHIWRIKY